MGKDVGALKGLGEVAEDIVYDENCAFGGRRTGRVYRLVLSRVSVEGLYGPKQEGMLNLAPTYRSSSHQR